MRATATRWALLFAASQLLACSHVSSSTAGPDNMAGDAWYVRTTWFLWFPVGSSIWHCPTPTRSGPVVCREATVFDQEESIEQLERRPPTDAPPTMIYTGDKKVEADDAPEPEEPSDPEPAEPPPPDDGDSDEPVPDAEEEGPPE